MMISCPSCQKGYRVAASAIPPGGREVRCSACAETWFERGEMAEVIAASAQGADLAPSYFGAAEQGGQVRMAAGGGRGAVIETTYEAPMRPGPKTRIEPRRDVGPKAPPAPRTPNDTPMAAPRAADPADEATPSPALEQQRALTVAYAPEAEAPPRPGEAFLALLRALRVKAGSLGGGGPASVTLSPADAAARDTRLRLRRAAANKVTPGRVAGWTLWAGAAGAACFVLTIEADRTSAAFPPLGRLYAMGAPPVTAPGLTVTASVERYAASVEGPVAELTGVVANTGQAFAVPFVTVTADGPNGPETQALPLAAVALPPGGERPFAVRALLPEGATTLSVEVTPDIARITPGGFALQPQGSGWAGPPSEMR